ncbi:MAG: hypothetical protein QM627_04435 [Luteolibacter sp.]
MFPRLFSNGYLLAILAIVFLTYLTLWHPGVIIGIHRFFVGLAPETSRRSEPPPPINPAPKAISPKKNSLPVSTPPLSSPPKEPPLTLSQSNTLLKAGKYSELIHLLERDREHASGPDLARIDNMLKGLRKLAPPRPPSAPPASGGSFLVNAASSTKPSTKNTRRVIALGGSPDGWFSALSTTSLYSSQQVVFQKNWPAGFIKQAWDGKYSITSIAGDARGWAVVLSRHADGSFPAQSYWGPGPFDGKLQNWISTNHSEGKHITSVAGFGDQWVVVMTAGTGWGHQRFTRPASYREDWISARLKEGYIITAAAGDRRASATGEITDTYFIVATQGTGWTRQSHWANASRDQFNPWFQEQTESMAPVALFGHPLRRGAVFAHGTRFPTRCSNFLGGSTQATVDWFNSWGVGLTEP